LPGQLGVIMGELEVTVAEITTILGTIEDREIVARVGDAVDAVAEITEEVEAAVAAVPSLLAEVEALAATANGLPLDVLVADISGVAVSASALLGGEAAQALPVRIETLVAELQSVVADVAQISAGFADADAAARLLAAADAATSTLQGVDAAIEGLPELVASLEALATTANGLPLDMLVAEITALSDSAGTLLGGPDAQALPAELAALAQDLRGVLGDVSVVTAELVEAEAAARLVAAVDAASSTLAGVDTAVAGLPELITTVEDLAASAAANAMLAAAETQALPAQFGAAAQELETVLAEVGGIVATLQEAETAPRLVEAIDAAAAALTTLDSSIEGVPALVDQASRVMSQAEDLELTELLARANTLLDSADALISSEGMQGLVPELDAALTEIAQLLAAFRDGGAVGNLNAALISARGAADGVADATERLPALLNRTTALLAQADATLAGFEGTSPAIRDARAALAEISRAAEAVASLARAIERRPNSLLTGR